MMEIAMIGAYCSGLTASDLLPSSDNINISIQPHVFVDCQLHVRIHAACGRRRTQHELHEELALARCASSSMRLLSAPAARGARRAELPTATFAEAGALYKYPWLGDAECLPNRMLPFFDQLS